MKKLFQYTKRPREDWTESDYDWDSEENEEYYAEDGETYAEDGEYYAEDGEVYAEDGETYAEDGEYYAEDGEVYAEDGEYYAEDGEVYAEDGEYYAEDGETYAEDGEYYAEDGEVYAEDGETYVENGEYYTENGEYYAEDGAIGYENEELYIEEDDLAGEEDKRKAGGLLLKFKEMPVMDRVIAMTGAAVLLLALITGGMLISSRIIKNQVSEFVTAGSQLQDISMIGEAGLMAVADAQIAKLNASMIVEEEQQEEEPEEYDENDYNRQVAVNLNTTSIQKDLKIKFTNQKTGKLVANVPFSVAVTDPDGKVSIWSDDDMDGIIYKKDIAPGTYKLTMEALTDERYADYSFPTGTKTVEVKKDIKYEKVDVADEVKTESEINAAKEDTAKNETVVESTLQDTVTWVESTVATASYTEVAKNTIEDPLKLKLASLDKKFMRMVTTAKGVTITATPGTEIKAGETVTLSVAEVTKDYFTADANETIDSISVVPDSVNWVSSDANVATVDSSGKVTGVAKGEATITYSTKIEVTTTVDNPDVSSGDEQPSTDVNKKQTIEVKGTIVIKVTETPAVKGTLSLDKTTAVMVVNGTETVQAAAKDFAEGKELVYAVVSDKETVATAKVDAAGKVTITGVAAGKAKITVSANYKEGATEDTKAIAVIEVTVGANKAITFENETFTAYAKVPTVINVTIKGAVTTTPVVTVETTDANVLKATVGTLKAENGVITVPVTLEGSAKGSATVTVKCTENNEEVKASCVVTLLTHPKEDAVTELKDSKGNLLYVNDNGTYRKAVYADYYLYEKFYLKGEVKYTGWQTIDGNVYFFTAEGKKVTGEQVIQGAKYNFASDGSLVTGSGAMGIDVSKWNGTIDWTAVKNSGINYVIIRCGYRGSSQGTLVEDPKFKANIKGATAAGLKVGVYFFTQAVDEREAVEEASMVLGLIKNYKISYPVFLDVESSGGRADAISKETRTAVCTAFCQTIQNAGYTAGVYANKTWLENRIDASALGAYKIWLAQYAAAPTYTGRYELWQYRSTGKVSGISGNVDMNWSYLGY